MPERRFPPPWFVEETDASFIHSSSSATRTARSISLSLILALAHLRHDASQKRPSCLCWQQDGGPSDDAKLIVRY